MLEGHRARRKERRKEERREAKRQRREAANQSNADDDGTTTTTTTKKAVRPPHPREPISPQDAAERQKQKMLIESIGRRIEALKRSLASWAPPLTPEELAAKREEEKSALKGAATPAWIKYPELYPEIERERKRKEDEELAKRRNLLEEFRGRAASNDETRKLLALQFELGFAHLATSHLPSSSGAAGERARSAFEEALELDTSDPWGARVAIVAACFEGREVVEEEDLKRVFDSSGVYDLTCMKWYEVLGRVMVGEEDEEEEDDRPHPTTSSAALKEALQLNPYIGDLLFFLHRRPDVIRTKFSPKVVKECLREERAARLREDLVSSSALLGRCDAGMCGTGVNGDARSKERAKAFAVCFLAAHLGALGEAEAFLDLALQNLRYVNDAELIKAIQDGGDGDEDYPSSSTSREPSEDSETVARRRSLSRTFDVLFQAYVSQYKKELHVASSSGRGL